MKKRFSYKLVTPSVTVIDQNKLAVITKKRLVNPRMWTFNKRELQKIII